MPVTTISALPYPAMTDPPNGPDQLHQLARAIEPKLINRYSNATTRASAIPAPLPGMITFRDDAKVLEYWNASTGLWTGTDQSVAFATGNAASTGTDRAFTTAQSPAQATSTVRLTNPSALYKMTYVIAAEFTVQYNWTTAGQFANVYHWVRNGAPAAGARLWQRATTLPGNSIYFSGQFPMLRGSIGAGASVDVTTYLTVMRGGGAAGVINFLAGWTNFTVFGVTSV